MSRAFHFAYGRLGLTALIVLLLDQLTKSWIVSRIPQGTFVIGPESPPYTVIPDFFYIVHVGNPGAAWGIFEGYGLALAILGILAVVAILIFRKHFELHRPLMQYAFGLLIGGIIGNIIDRLRFGHVVDFLDFHFGSYRYPSFNVADSGITVGVAIYILAGLFDWKRTFCKSATPQGTEVETPEQPQASAQAQHDDETDHKG